jgi:hypothetical protein
MPWRCPACGIPIRHSELEERPRVGVTYRCHICRLELVLDTVTDKLAAASTRVDDANDRPRST